MLNGLHGFIRSELSTGFGPSIQEKWVRSAIYSLAPQARQRSLPLGWQLEGAVLSPSRICSGLRSQYSCPLCCSAPTRDC